MLACAICGKTILVGEPISWSRKGERKIYHAACNPKVVASPVASPIVASPVASPIVASPVASPIVASPVASPKNLSNITASKLSLTNHWITLLQAVLPYVNRVLLIGAPGTGKSIAAMQVANCKHRITMTETTSEDVLLGMWHLRDGKTVWSDGPITTAMKQGEAVLIDEIDHYSPEAASLLYSLIDDNPHVETPEGSVIAQDGYKMIMTANEGLDTLPPAVQDRIEVIINASVPVAETLADVSPELRDLSLSYYMGLPKPVIRMPATVRRVRSFDKLVKAGFTPKVAARLIFGESLEIMSVIASVASKSK